jgi:hypothetical protein
MDEYIAKINRAHEMGLRMGKVLALADFQILVHGVDRKGSRRRSPKTSYTTT